MAKTVSVVVTDDLDGSPNAETVTFGFDGVTYEIDLARKNKSKLEHDFAAYISAARRVSRPGNRTSPRRQPAQRTNHAAVRAWARQHGHHVSERGRISAEVMQQYEAAR